MAVRKFRPAARLVFSANWADSYGLSERSRCIDLRRAERSTPTEGRNGPAAEVCRDGPSNVEPLETVLQGSLIFDPARRRESTANFFWARRSVMGT